MGDKTAKPETKILLFGLGAIGGFYAFILSRNTAVSLSVVARSNYDVVRENGLLVESQNHGTHRIHFEQVYRDLQGVHEKFDYIVCAHKAVNDNAVPSMLAHVTDDKTVFAIMQNGVGNEDPFRKHFPRNTIISSLVWVGASQESPGLIKHFASEYTEMGLFENENASPDAERARIDQFAELLRGGGTKVSIHDDIQVKRWEKVVWNAAWNPITTLTMVDTKTWLSEPEAMAMTRRLMEDVIKVGIRAGVALKYDLVDQLIERVLPMGGLSTSMQRDAQEGRPLELDVILGVPMRKAREFGMDVPTLAAVFTLTQAVNIRLSRKPS